MFLSFLSGSAAYNLAQFQLFCEIAPNYSVIIWRNQAFLLTLRQNIDDEITKAYASRVEQRLRTFRKVTNTKKSFSKVYVTSFGLYGDMYARKVTKQIIAGMKLPKYFLSLQQLKWSKYTTL